MEPSGTLDGNGIVRDNSKEKYGFKVKFAHKSPENDDEFSSPNFDLKLSCEAGQLFLFLLPWLFQEIK